MKRSFVACLYLSFCVTPLFAAEPIDIGSRLELFIDDYLVESLEGGATFDIKEFLPREVVLVLCQRGRYRSGDGQDRPGRAPP